VTEHKIPVKYLLQDGNVMSPQ